MPGRFATTIETACSKPGFPASAVRITAGSGSGPSITRATSATKSGRPSRTATTTFRTSAAERKNPDAWSSTRRPASTSAPAGSWAWAPWIAWATSPMETDRARSRSGSGSMRTVRRAPPSTWTPAVRGTSASSRATSSPSLRSSPAGSASAACSVSVRNGTSSMVSARTMGRIAVGGRTSGCAASSWCTFTSDGSSGSLTLKRTVTSAESCRLTL